MSGEAGQPFAWPVHHPGPALLLIRRALRRAVAQGLGCQLAGTAAVTGHGPERAFDPVSSRPCCPTCMDSDFSGSLGK